MAETRNYTTGYPCCGGVTGHNAWCSPSPRPSPTPDGGTEIDARITDALWLLDGVVWALRKSAPGLAADGGET